MSLHCLLSMPECLNLSKKIFSPLPDQVDRRKAPPRASLPASSVWGSLQPNSRHLSCIQLKNNPLSSPISQQGMMRTSCTRIRAKCFPKAAISLKAGRQTAFPFFQGHRVHACLNYKNSSHKWCELPLGTHRSHNPAMQYRHSSTLANPLQNTWQ